MAIYCYAIENGGASQAERLEKELVVVSHTLKNQDSWYVASTSPFFDDDTRAGFVTEFVKEAGGSDFAANVISTHLFVMFNFLIPTEQLVSDGLGDLLSQVAVDYEEISTFSSLYSSLSSPQLFLPSLLLLFPFDETGSCVVFLIIPVRGHRKEVDVIFSTASSLTPSQVDFFKNTIKTDFLSADDKPIFTHSVHISLSFASSPHVSRLMNLSLEVTKFPSEVSTMISHGPMTSSPTSAPSTLFVSSLLPTFALSKPSLYDFLFPLILAFTFVLLCTLPMFFSLLTFQGITADPSAEEEAQKIEERKAALQKEGIYSSSLIEALVAQKSFEF